MGCLRSCGKIKYSERWEVPTNKPGRKPRIAKPGASSGNGTKADAIRDVAKSLPQPVRPRDVRDVLAGQGIHTSSTVIGKVLTAMGMRRRRRRKAAAGTSAPAARSTTASLSIDDLVAAKKLVAQVGSVEKVKAALAALARLG